MAEPIDFEKGSSLGAEGEFTQIDGYSVLFGAVNPTPTGSIPQEMLPSKSLQFRYYLDNNFILSPSESALTGFIGLLGSTLGKDIDLTEFLVNNATFIVADAELIMNEPIASDQIGKEEIELSNYVYRVGAVTDEPILEEDLVKAPEKATEGESFNLIDGDKFVSYVDSKNRVGKSGTLDTASKKIKIKGGKYVSYIAVKKHILRQELEIQSLVTAVGTMAAGKFFPTLLFVDTEGVNVTNYSFEEIEPAKTEGDKIIPAEKQWVVSETFGIAPPTMKSVDARRISSMTDVRLHTELTEYSLAYDMRQDQLKLPLKERIGFLQSIAAAITDGTLTEAEKATFGITDANNPYIFKLARDVDNASIRSIDSSNMRELAVLTSDDEVSYQAYYESPNYGIEMSSGGRILLESRSITVKTTSPNFSIFAVRTIQGSPYLAAHYFEELNLVDIISSESQEGTEKPTLIKTLRDDETDFDFNSSIKSSLSEILDSKPTSIVNLGLLGGNIRGERAGKAIQLSNPREVADLFDTAINSKGNQVINLRIPENTYVFSIKILNDSVESHYAIISSEELEESDNEASLYITARLSPDSQNIIYTGGFQGDKIFIRSDNISSVIVLTIQIADFDEVEDETFDPSKIHTPIMKDADILRDRQGRIHIYYVDVKGSLNVLVSTDGDDTWTPYFNLFKRPDTEGTPSPISKLRVIRNDERSYIHVFFSYKNKLLLQRINYAVFDLKSSDTVSEIQKDPAILVVGNRDDPEIAQEIEDEIIDIGFIESEDDFDGEHSVAIDQSYRMALFYTQDNKIKLKYSSANGEEWVPVFSDDFILHTPAKEQTEPIDGTNPVALFNKMSTHMNIFYLRNDALYVKTIPIDRLETINSDNFTIIEEEISKMPSILIQGDLTNNDVLEEIAKNKTFEELFSESNNAALAEIIASNSEDGKVIPCGSLIEDAQNGFENMIASSDRQVIIQKFDAYIDNRNIERVLYRISKDPHIIRSSHNTGSDDWITEISNTKEE